MPGKQRELEVKAADPDPRATLAAALDRRAAADRLARIGTLTDAHGVRCAVETERLISRGYADMLAR